MKTRIRILDVTDRITSLCSDYEIIDRHGVRDSVAGTLTEDHIPVMYWDKRPKVNIAKEYMRNQGYVCEQ